MTVATGYIWHNILKQNHNAVVIDVRDGIDKKDLKWGAIHIPLSRDTDFIKEVNKLDSNKNYFVYSNSGEKSEKACSILEANGFKETYNLAGGLINYIL